MSSPLAEPDPVARYFDEHAVDFDTIYEPRKSPLRAARDRLTRGTVVQRLSFVDSWTRGWTPGRVLDVGCGAGRFSVMLAARGWEAVGLDFAPEMVALADAQARPAGVGERCRFVAADFLAWEPDGAFDASGAFDLGLAIGLFDYVEDPTAILRKLAALTGGRLVASFPKRMHPLVPLRRARLGAAGCPVWFYGRAEVEALGRAHLDRFEVRSFHRDYLLVGG